MYLKDTNSYQVIPADLKQTFANKFMLNIGKNEIVKMKNSNVITERDLKISKLLFQFKFATARQIYSYLNEDTEKNNLKLRLDKLVKYHVLNKFMLSSFEEDVIAPDAYVIYCLDLGGRYLLENYSSEDTSDWYTIVNMKTSSLISKDLAVTEFYLQLLNTCSNKIEYFKPNPEYRMNKKNIFPSFEMSLNVDGFSHYFVGEVFRDFDFPIYFREKLTKLEMILTTNAWKKYFFDTDNPPNLLLIVDSDNLALDCAKASQNSEVQNIRYTTDERIQSPLYELGSFLRFNSEKQLLEKVRASKFIP